MRRFLGEKIFDYGDVAARDALRIHARFVGAQARFPAFVIKRHHQPPVGFAPDRAAQAAVCELVGQGVEFARARRVVRGHDMAQIPDHHFFGLPTIIVSRHQRFDFLAGLLAQQVSVSIARDPLPDGGAPGSVL